MRNVAQRCELEVWRARAVKGWGRPFKGIVGVIYVNIGMCRVYGLGLRVWVRHGEEQN